MTVGTAQDVVRQKMALLQEAEIAIYSIQAGLVALQKNRPYAPKPYYFTWLLLLATGLERLMKIVICLHEFETVGAFPSRQYLARRIGHNLLRLRDEVIQRCYTSTYLMRPFAQEDHKFVETDPLLNQLLGLLDDFARDDRYIFMNGIVEPTIGREWPKYRWEELEKTALSDDTYFQMLQEDKLTELKVQANIQLKAYIERFVRALTRLFIFGELGDLARSNTTTVWEFIRLEDGNLGQKEYNLE